MIVILQIATRPLDIVMLLNGHFQKALMRCTEWMDFWWNFSQWKNQTLVNLTYTHKQTHTHTQRKESEANTFGFLQQPSSMWILDFTPNHHFYLFIYLLNVWFLSLLASHLLFGNTLLEESVAMFSTIEHNRIATNGKQKYSLIDIQISVEDNE